MLASSCYWKRATQLPERRLDRIIKAFFNSWAGWQHAVRTELTPHQRDVFVALALNGVPIDVLAERLDSTRGALYKTLHDARRKLREVTGDDR